MVVFSAKVILAFFLTKEKERYLRVITSIGDERRGFYFLSYMQVNTFNLAFSPDNLKTLVGEINLKKWHFNALIL